MSDAASDPRAAFRALPSVDDALREPELAALARAAGREAVLGHLRGLLDGWRAEIAAGALGGAALERRLAGDGLAAAVRARLAADRRRGLARAVNATGVVLHTGLGRAPVHPEVAARMAEAAGSYCVLEVDRESGQRNQRDERVGELLRRLTGAEAGLCVNNNAAAVMLTLQTFAGGREAIVSRGELVEIGGSFRVPDVMTRAGVRLVEVGTTNRTRAADYRAAVGEATGLLLKVHTSNFKVVGFAEEVAAHELAELGRELGVATAFDLGSGLLEHEGSRPLDMLGGEPLVRAAVECGLDVVTFSGDKLLGGPQAGLLVGRAQALHELRRNPIYRAVRCDKATLAGVEATLELYLAGRADELPARRMLRRSADELREEAQDLARYVAGLPGFEAEVLEASSQPGSGSAPDVFLPTWVVGVAHAQQSADTLARALRRGEPPVFARIQEERLLLDPRTLLPGDAGALLEALGRVAEGE